MSSVQLGAASLLRVKDFTKFQIHFDKSSIGRNPPLCRVKVATHTNHATDVNFYKDRTGIIGVFGVIMIISEGNEKLVG